MPDLDHEKELVTRFVRHYETCLGVHYPQIDFPERTGRPGEIDGLAKGPGLRDLAIEHTRIQTFPEQNTKEARFRNAFSGLEKELEERIPGRIVISIPAVKGKGETLRRSLRDWALAVVPTLPDGEHLKSIKNLPDVSVKKESKYRKGYFRIWIRWDGSESIRDIMIGQFLEKRDKLMKYKIAGATAILLFESVDVQLATLELLSDSFHKVNPSHYDMLDQVWLVETDGTVGEWCEFHCLFAP